MAATYQNFPRSTGRPPVQKSRTKKTVSQQSPSKIINTADNIKIRFGNNSSQTSMYKPTSILKKNSSLPSRPYIDSFSDNILNWHQPTDLELIRTRPTYSPLRTPPRLRTLITPPGIVPYRRRYDLHRLSSPLPAIDSLLKPSVGLDTWGRNPIDHDLSVNTNLIHPYPSPLTHSGVESGLSRQRKSYIVVPHLNNLLSAPEPSEYMFIRQNDAFANRYIEEFISKYIQDQMIPDLLLEVMNELDREKQNDEYYRSEIRRYNNELTKRMNQQYSDDPLLSDQWIREYDYQRGLPSTHDAAYLRATNRLRYHDLPPDAQGSILANLNQELVDYEIQSMLRELSNEALANRKRAAPTLNNDFYDMYDTDQRPFDDVQYNAVEDYAQSKLLDSTLLDQLILKCIKQKGTIMDVDDASRLLDAIVLQNLITQYQLLDTSRSRPMNDYN